MILRWLCAVVVSGGRRCVSVRFVVSHGKVERRISEAVSPLTEVHNKCVCAVHSTIGHTLFCRYVVTRWYRAPELMLSVRNYDAAIDVWSAGCILGEILHRKPLYAGGNYIQQLKLITALVGKPAESDLQFVTNPRYTCTKHTCIKFVGLRWKLGKTRYTARVVS